MVDLLRPRLAAAAALALLVACGPASAEDTADSPQSPLAEPSSGGAAAQPAASAGARRPEAPARRCARCQREYSACTREEAHRQRTGAESCRAGFRQCLAPASSPTSGEAPATDEGLASCRAPGDTRTVPVLDPSFPSRTLVGP